MSSRPKFIYVIYIATTPDKVFSALTDPKMSARYWFGYEVTLEWNVGAQFARARPHPRARAVDYGRIRTILYGASPISPDLLTEAIAVFQCGFVQQYGMTERAGTTCALTPEDLLNTARQYLDSANMQIVVVGDRTQIESQAALFGDLEIFDAQGSPQK